MVGINYCQRLSDSRRHELYATSKSADYEVPRKLNPQHNYSGHRGTGRVNNAQIIILFPG